MEASSTAVWLPCGNEGGTCYIADHHVDKFVTVRYGNAGNYNFQFTKGIQNYPCNGQLGDPDLGVVKKCEYTIWPVFGAINDSNNWNPWMSEGWQGYLSGAHGRQVWVRYGHGNRWNYTIVATGNAQLFRCLNDSFGG